MSDAFDTFNNQEIRRTLQNLLPGSRYASRVRAVNEFGLYSDWSEALEFTADGSQNAGYTLEVPSAPTIQPQINSLMVLMNYAAENDGISWYIVEHSSNNVTFSEIARTQVPLYVHQVTPGVTHYYRYYVIDIHGQQSPVSPSNSGVAIEEFSHKPYSTIVIAAGNSKAKGKENADFVCDTIDDQVQIQAAIDLLGSNSGEILLLDGYYHLSGPVTNTANNSIQIRGMGRKVTHIAFFPETPTSMLSTSTNNWNVFALQDLTIENQPWDEQDNTSSAPALSISKVAVLSNVDIHVKNSAYKNGGAVSLRGKSHVVDCNIEGSGIRYTGNAFHALRVVNCHIESEHGDCINLVGSGPQLFLSNSLLYSERQGVWAIRCGPMSLTKMQVHGNIINSIGSASGVFGGGIKASSLFDSAITGNYIRISASNNAQIGIELESSVFNVNISTNVLYGASVRMRGLNSTSELRNINISNNTFEWGSMGLPSILLDGSNVKNNKIDGNILPAGNGSNQDGIVLQNGTSNNFVTNNKTFSEWTPSSGAALNIRHISCTKNVVVGNDFSQGYTTSIVDHGTDTEFGSGNNTVLGWIPAVGSGGGAGDLDDLTDVDTTGVISGDVLTYDGTKWIPAAPPGASGGDKNYVHDQPTTSTIWTVTHGLDKRVSVVAVDSTDREIKGLIDYVSNNQVTITFNTAVSGKAYCN